MGYEWDLSSNRSECIWDLYQLCRASVPLHPENFSSRIQSTDTPLSAIASDNHSALSKCTQGAEPRMSFTSLTSQLTSAVFFFFALVQFPFQ